MATSDDLRRENEEAKAIIRDLLESYLASFRGNKDELARRAERLLKQRDRLT